MNYLTNYYKNLSEKLDTQVKNLLSINEGLLNEIITRDEAMAARKSLAQHQANRLTDLIGSFNSQADSASPYDWARNNTRDRLAALAQRLGAIPVTDSDYRAMSADDFHAGFTERRVRPSKVEFYDPETETIRSDKVKFFQTSPEEQQQGAAKARKLADERLQRIKDEKAKIAKYEEAYEAAKKSMIPRDPPWMDSPISLTGKAVGKTALKMLPVVGTLASVAAIADRAEAGDYSGAALEAGSEIADWVPLAGTPLSLAIQGYLAARDAGETDSTDNKAKREVDAAIKSGSPSKVRVTGPKF